MGEYKIRIYPSAKKDLEEAVDYINMLSPDAAIKYYDELISGIESLSDMPFRCPLLKEPLLASKGYRFLIVNNYLVFFVVEGRVVQIRRILYAQRDHSTLL